MEPIIDNNTLHFIDAQRMQFIYSSDKALVSHFLIYVSLFMNSIFELLHRRICPLVDFLWHPENVDVLDHAPEFFCKGSLMISSADEKDVTPRSYFCYLIPFKIIRVWLETHSLRDVARFLNR